MVKRKEKEAGKIIKKKKVRMGPSLRLRRLRWDIIAIVVIVAVIAYVGYALVFASMQEQGNQEGIKSMDELYEGLEKVIVKKYRNVSVDLWYYIRGTIPCKGYDVGVKDFAQIRLFYYEITVPTETKVGNKTVTENKTIGGYNVLYLRVPYLTDLLSITGVGPAVYGYTNNVSHLFIDDEALNKTLKGNLTKKLLGKEEIEVGTLGKVSTYKVRYVYDVTESGKAYHVNATVWYEDKFKIPVKLVFNINGRLLAIELKSADVIKQ
ncbi:MAG: hypothetical protein J7L12_02065 [Desulfurococcales archaeon]|nr:hypothetical protein [Desulfurococcales archaeon]